MLLRKVILFALLFSISTFGYADDDSGGLSGLVSVAAVKVFEEDVASLCICVTKELNISPSLSLAFGDVKKDSYMQVKIHRNEDHKKQYYFYLNVSRGMLVAGNRLELEIGFNSTNKAARPREIYAVLDILDELKNDVISSGRYRHPCEGAKIIKTGKIISSNSMKL